MTNLLAPKEAPIELDKIWFWNAASRELFDQHAGVESSNLTHDEIERLRPRVYERVLAHATECPVFLKMHDAYRLTSNAEPLISHNASSAAIYLVRNPLDIAVSFASHSHHMDQDLTIARMCMSDYALCSDEERLESQLRQMLLDWSSHVQTWLGQDCIPVHVLRFEDMKLDPVHTFHSAIRSIGLAHSESEVALALENCHFELLQQMERKYGFPEGWNSKSPFFRQGEIDSWKRHLSEQQVQQVVTCHEKMMRQLGYLE